MADPSTWLPLTRDSVQAARELIRPHVHVTPVMTNRTLDALASSPADLEGTRWAAGAGREAAAAAARPTIRLWLKCEIFLRVGAF